jgi:hypothetical protein
MLFVGFEQPMRHESKLYISDIRGVKPNVYAIMSNYGANIQERGFLDVGPNPGKRKSG